MRISMWMLAEHLAKYAPAERITQGERVLQNARLFSDELRISRRTVYLNQLQSDRVLCSAGHDLLVLSADDVNAVFNDVLDAFEYYSDWSADTMERIERGCGAEELLKRVSEALGRAVILADAAFYMRELYLPPALERVPSLRALRERRLLPLDDLMLISAMPQIRVPGAPSYLVETPTLRPAAAVSNLFSGGVHRGWLITVNASGSYTRGDLDRQDAVCELLEAWLDRDGQMDGRMDLAPLFLRLLGSPGEADAGTEERLKPLGWYPGDAMQLYLLSPAPEAMYAVEGWLRRRSAYAFAMHREGRLLYILNHRLTPPEALEPELRPLLERTGGAAAKSPVFTRLSMLRDAYRAAEAALRFGAAAPGEIRCFDEAALPYAASLLRAHSAFDLRHPALGVLEELDRRSRGGALKQTLCAFLRHNCSFTETAAALYIHRSTLLYRLDRIREAAGVDLDDYPTRLHLMLSYLLEEDAQ